MQSIDLSGIWECTIPQQRGPVRLPGTLDEGGFGSPDDPRSQWKADDLLRRGLWQEGEPIVTRLTRKYVYEGSARFSRKFAWDPPAGSRVFLDCERTRHLRLSVNGQEAPAVVPPTLSAPCVFEVTGLVTGQDEFTLLSDNSYPGWPRDAIIYASAASDETQTNWNGILGTIRLRTEKTCFISGIRVLPRGNQATVCVELNLGRDWKGILRVSSPALAREKEVRIRQSAGICEIRICADLSPEAKRWDLEEGNLHPLTVSADGLESRSVRFGIRDFAARDGRLSLNGRRIFLRGETSCAVFPETGYCPTDTENWMDILGTYRSYGVNCVRFHSHCPPEAAFTAADRLGMLLQPELSHWDPEHAFATEEARRYYAAEARQILRHLANHPSFVMLTLGNELHFTEEGRAFAGRLLCELRETDPTRLYANGSNPFYGTKGPDPDSGFFTASDDRGRMLRGTSSDFQGWLNQAEPGACRDYSAELAALRADSDQPVFSFETGQYEILPDFGEIRDFRGVTVPENLKRMESRMRAAGLEFCWPDMVRATGENALQCYRAEVEAALRTDGWSGISLLGLQDFPGQGTALVGMMNAHLQPKPFGFARPERFAAFFRDVLPLARLPRYVFTAGEACCFPVQVANYGKTDLAEDLTWSLDGAGFSLSGGPIPLNAPAGGLSEKHDLRFRLAGIRSAVRLALVLRYGGSSNEYPLWVYPDAVPACPPSVHECRVLDQKARKILSSGGIVYLSPDSTAETLPHSVQAQFSPDFWSVCTFPSQSGCMGQWIDAAHPLFRNFPTDFFSSWQWQPMASQRVLLLPRRMKAIVTELDSAMQLRPMAQLLECRCGGGRLLVSSFGLQHLQQYPNARALQQAIYDYLASDLFNPEEELSLDTAAAFLPFG